MSVWLSGMHSHKQALESEDTVPCANYLCLDTPPFSGNVPRLYRAYQRLRHASRAMAKMLPVMAAAMTRGPAPVDTAVPKKRFARRAPPP